MPEVTEGMMAPDFSLPLDNGATFCLSEHRGRPVVLFFYPEDDSGGCKDENIEFSERAADFAALGVTLVGISPDTLESHGKFRRKYDLQVPLAADPERVAIEAFGLWRLKKLYGREFMGVIRATVIVDAEGRIWRIMRATRILGHAQKVLDAVRELTGSASN